MKKFQWFRLWWITNLLITVCFLVLILESYSLIIGWMIGIIFGFLKVNLNNQLIIPWLIKSKSRAWLKGFFKNQIFLIIFSLFLIGIILFNKLMNNLQWNENDLKVAYGPINIFTLALGLTMGHFYSFVLPAKVIKPQLTTTIKE